jgi:hypothetical protein
MQNLDPSYLRYIYDSIEKGSIHPENASELPDGLIGLYEETFDDHLPVLKRQYIFRIFTLFALLKKEVSISFVAEVLEDSEANIADFISTYSSWFNSPESGKYQLYHERLKVYVLQKLSEGEIDKIHEKLISRLEKAIEEKKADEFEKYALEFLGLHYYVRAMFDKDKKRLIDFSYNQSIWNRQLQLSKSYNWTKASLKAVMDWSAKYSDEEVIECSFRMVDIHLQEQNSTTGILELVATGDCETALSRIETFGDHSKDGLQRKFILYMLCLMELTLLESRDKDFARTSIDKLLKHLDQNIPEDHTILSWNDFFSSYLMFEMACKWEEMGLDYIIIYQRSNKLTLDFLTKRTIINDYQVNVLLNISFLCYKQTQKFDLFMMSFNAIIKDSYKLKTYISLLKNTLKKIYSSNNNSIKKSIVNKLLLNFFENVFKADRSQETLNTLLVQFKNHNEFVYCIYCEAIICFFDEHDFNLLKEIYDKIIGLKNKFTLLEKTLVVLEKSHCVTLFKWVESELKAIKSTDLDSSPEFQFYLELKSKLHRIKGETDLSNSALEAALRTLLETKVKKFNKDKDISKFVLEFCKNKYYTRAIELANDISSDYQKTNTQKEIIDLIYRNGDLIGSKDVAGWSDNLIEKSIFLGKLAEVEILNRGLCHGIKIIQDVSLELKDDVVFRIVKLLLKDSRVDDTITLCNEITDNDILCEINKHIALYYLNNNDLLLFEKYKDKIVNYFEKLDLLIEIAGNNDFKELYFDEFIAILNNEDIISEIEECNLEKKIKKIGDLGMNKTFFDFQKSSLRYWGKWGKVLGKNTILYELLYLNSMDNQHLIYILDKIEMNDVAKESFALQIFGPGIKKGNLNELREIKNFIGTSFGNLKLDCFCIEGLIAKNDSLNYIQALQLMDEIYRKYKQLVFLDRKPSQYGALFIRIIEIELNEIMYDQIIPLLIQLQMDKSFLLNSLSENQSSYDRRRITIAFFENCRKYKYEFENECNEIFLKHLDNIIEEALNNSDIETLCSLAEEKIAQGNKEYGLKILRVSLKEFKQLLTEYDLEKVVSALSILLKYIDLHYIFVSVNVDLTPKEKLCLFVSIYKSLEKQGNEKVALEFLESSIDLLSEISIDSFSIFELEEFALPFIKHDKIVEAENLGIRIYKTSDRFRFWNKLGCEAFLSKGYTEGNELSLKFNSDEARMHFQRGVIRLISFEKINFLNIGNILKNPAQNISNIEYILQIYLLNKILFTGHFEDKYQKANKIFNLQWAIDLKKELDQIPN